MNFDRVDAALVGTKYMIPAKGRQIYDLIVKHKLRRALELGFAHGKSTCYIAAAVDELGRDGHVTTIDRTVAAARKPNIHQLLEKCGLTERVTPIFAQRSYTWELMQLLEKNPQPRFDFAFIDGGHTWDVTGYGFFLVDRLLAPGGWIVFDDLDWTIATSEGIADKASSKALPEIERTTPQVRKVFELLVRTHPSYRETFEDAVGGWAWGWARKNP